MKLPHAQVPAEPGAIPVDLSLVCTSPSPGSGPLTAPVKLTVRRLDGGEAVEGSAGDNAPIKVTFYPTIGRVTWSPAAPLAAGSYELSAQLGESSNSAGSGGAGADAGGSAGAPTSPAPVTSATFEVLTPYTPALEASLSALVIQDINYDSPGWCCEDTCHVTRCEHAGLLNSGRFTASWTASPWSIAEVRWDEGPTLPFVGDTTKYDSLNVDASGAHCVHVTFLDRLTKAPLGERTRCDSLSFEPTSIISCSLAKNAQQFCIGKSSGSADFLAQACPGEPPLPPDGSGPPAGGAGGQSGGSGAPAGGSSAAQAPAGQAGAGQAGAAQALMGEGGASSSAAHSLPSDAGCSVRVRAGGGGWLLAVAALAAAGSRRRPSHPPLRQAKGRRRG